MTWRNWLRPAVLALAIWGLSGPAWAQTQSAPDPLKEFDDQSSGALLARISELSETLELSEQRADGLQGKLATVSEQNRGLVTQVDGLRGAMTALQQRNDSLQSQVDGLQSRLSESRLESQSLLAQIGALQAAIADGEQQKGTLASQAATLKQTLGERTEELGVLNERLAALSSALAEKDERIATLSGELGGLKEADAARALQAANLDEQLRAGQTEIVRLQAALSDARAQGREDQGMFGDLRAAVATAEAAVRTQIEAAQKSAMEAAAAVRGSAGLEEQIAELSSRADQALTALDMARDEVQNHAMRLLDLQSRLGEAAAEAEAQKERADALAARISRVESEVSSLREQRSSLNLQRIVLAILLVASLIATIVMWRRRGSGRRS